jgi:hypothetical protein
LVPEHNENNPYVNQAGLESLRACAEGAALARGRRTKLCSSVRH